MDVKVELHHPNSTSGSQEIEDFLGARSPFRSLRSLKQTNLWVQVTFLLCSSGFI
jgi:hypothetical protein